MPFRAKLASTFVCAAALNGACSSDTHVSVVRAPGFESQGAHVSVFAVYRDGRLSTEAWDELGPRLSTALGPSPCEAGFSRRLRSADKKLFDSLEREAKSNGVTDEMLVRVGASATGDLVLVLEVWGTLKSPSKQESSPASAPAMSMGRGGRRGGGRSGRPGHASSSTVANDDALEMVARAYSPKAHEWVAQVEMRYSGTDVDEALARFNEEIGQLLPGASCSGWAWKEPESPPAPPAPSASVPIPALVP
jgi:hypothetical protein